MKKFILIFLVIALIACIGYIVLLKNGYSEDSIKNLPKTIDVTADCSEIENLLVTSTISVRISNSSDKTYNNVKVKVTGYDIDGNITKQKTTVFERSLEAYMSITKPITMPAKTERCDCVVEDLN